VTPARLRPVTPPHRIAVVAADHDQIVGREPVHRLAQTWGCDLWSYQHGHITVMTARGITARLHDRVLERIEDTVAGVALAG